MTPLFQNRDFVRLWTAALLSNYGSMLRGVALPLLAVLVLDAEPRHMAWLGVSTLLPGFAFGLLAAPWVDRRRRLPLLVSADAARALLLAAVGIGTWQGWIGLPGLYVAAFALGSFHFLFGVANAAFLPSLVPREQLLAANSRIKAAEAVTEGAGFASAGWLVQWLGAPFALLVDAASFGVSAIVLRGIRTPEPAPPPAKPGAGLQLGAGLRAIAENDVLRALVAAAWLRAFGHQVVGVVYMLYVTRALGFAPGLLGMVFAVGAVSSFGGALLAERAGRRIGPGPAMAAGLGVAGLAIGLLPFAPPASWLGVALLIVHQLGDGADVLYDVNERSVRQRIVAGDRLGRVTGALRFGELGAMLLASALGAWVAETFGLRAALGLGACGVALGGLAIALSRAGRLRATGA
jgi:Na+/melibiose symporter-like transporter